MNSIHTSTIRKQCLNIRKSAQKSFSDVFAKAALELQTYCTSKCQAAVLTWTDGMIWWRLLRYHECLYWCSATQVQSSGLLPLSTLISSSWGVEGLRTIFRLLLLWRESFQRCAIASRLLAHCVIERVEGIFRRLLAPLRSLHKFFLASFCTKLWSVSWPDTARDRNCHIHFRRYIYIV